MARLTLFSLIFASMIVMAGCSSTKNAGPPKKQSLSVQPHNMPADWEGAGALGGMMGPQYQD